MGISIDQFLQDVLDKKKQKPKVDTQVDDLLKGMETTSRLRASAGSATTPDAATRVLRLEMQTGLPTELIERNIDAVEKEANKQDFDPDKFRQQSPLVAKWLAENQNHLKAATPDLTRLSWLERQFRNIKSQFQQGVNTVEMSELGGKAYHGTITKDEDKRLDAIQAENEALGSPDDYGFSTLSQVPGAIAQQIPMLGVAIGGALDYGSKGLAHGAAGGAIIGAVGGAAVGGVGAVPGAAAGAAAGALALGGKGAAWGGAIAIGEMERNLAFLEYRKLKDETGKPLDLETAKTAALIVGVLNGAAEKLELNVIAKTIPGLRALSKEGIKKALMTKTMRTAIQRYVKNIALVIPTEAGVEFYQELTKDVAGTLQQLTQDGSIESMPMTEILGKLFSPEHLANALESAKQGALAGGGIATVAGSAGLAIDAHKVNVARRNSDFFQALGTTMKESELQAKLPEKMQEVVERLTKDGPIETVYAPLDTFNEYWQSQNLDPADVAERITGSRSAYDEAARTGGDIAIPMARYATTIAPTDHNGYFVNEIRLAPDAPNGREGKILKKQMDAEEKERAAEIAKQQPEIDLAATTLAEKFTVQLTDTKRYDAVEIATHVKLLEDSFRAVVSRGVPLAKAVETFGKLNIQSMVLTPTADATFQQGLYPDNAYEAAIRDLWSQQGKNGRLELLKEWKRVYPEKQFLPGWADLGLEDLPQHVQDILGQERARQVAQINEVMRVPKDMIGRYKNIMNAAREMALDNIDNFDESQLRKRINSLLNFLEISDSAYAKIDTWLSTLSPEQLETATAGEETDMKKLMKKAPAKTEKLLQEIFDALSDIEGGNGLSFEDNQGFWQSPISSGFLYGSLTAYPLPPGFHSKAEQLIEQRMPDVADVGQVRAIFRDIKADEQHWLGLDKLLADKPNDAKITKQEVMDHLWANRLQIVEIDSGGELELEGDDMDIEEADRLLEEMIRTDVREDMANQGWGTIHDQATGEWYAKLEGNAGMPSQLIESRMVPRDINGYVGLRTYGPYMSRADAQRAAINLIVESVHADDALMEDYNERAFEAYRDETLGPQSNTVFRQYTVPGGTNYREIKFTLPQLPGKKFLQSTHWGPLPNVFAFVQATDRVTMDGKKLLHAEAIQSDLHEQGREKGYVSPEDEAVMQPLRDKVGKAQDQLHQFQAIMADKYGFASWFSLTEGNTGKDNPNHLSIHETRKLAELRHAFVVADDAQQEQYNKMQTAIVDAPFKKTWHEFVLKRLLRMAAEGGYDGISWSTGTQVASHFSLSQAVKKIDWSYTAPNTKAPIFGIFGENEDLTLGVTGLNDRLMTHGVPIKDLNDYIGKALADKVRADIAKGSNVGRFEGDDLITGGHGMRGFYDGIIEQFLKSFTKKYGAKPDMTTIPIEGENVGVENRLRVEFDPQRQQRYFENDEGIAPMGDKPINPLGYVRREEGVFDINDVRKPGDETKDGSSVFTTRDLTDIHQLLLTPELKTAALKNEFALYQNPMQAWRMPDAVLMTFDLTLGKARPDHVLHLDRPFQNQPEYVQKALLVIADIEGLEYAPPSGENTHGIYGIYGQQIYDDLGVNEDEAVRILHAADIDGVQRSDKHLFISKNTRPGEKPWRVTRVVVDGVPVPIPVVHNDFISYEAALDHIKDLGGVESKDIFQDKNGQPRGRIRFSEQGINIDLFKDADPSTLIHETGHFYMQMLQELAPDNESIAGDLKLLRDWVGAHGALPLSRDQHEMVARGFEAYLFEGKAPTTDLHNAFSNFRAWLLRVYQSIVSLNVQLTPEVRGVFDRLLASEDAITAAQHELAAEPLFADPEAVGMDSKQAQGYAAAVLETRAQAQDDLSQRMLADVQREQSRQWKAARDKIRAEVTEEVNSDPVQRARALLTRGTLPDGSALPEGVEPFKLRKTALVATYGEDILKQLPRPHVYSATEGIHHDIAADRFGIDSGDSLIKLLIGSENSLKRIERLTDERMATENPDIQKSGKLPQAAMDAMHNEKRALLLRQELQHLARTSLGTLKGLIRKVVRPIPTIESVRQDAEDIMRGKMVRDIKPNVYHVAESKANKAALEALLKGDVELAFDEKTRELFNHELYRAASAAVRKIDRVVETVNRYGTASTRERLTRAGGTYLAQIDSILERFDFKKATNKSLTRRQSLLEFAQEQAAMGLPVDIPEELLNEANKKHYKDLTYTELQLIDDTIKQINHQANVKNRLVATGRARTFAEAKADITSTIYANHKASTEPLDTAPGFAKRFKIGVKAIHASHTKLEFLFEWLDKNVPQGTVWQYLFKPLAEAEDVETILMRDSVRALDRIFSAYTRNERATWFYHKIQVPELNASLNKSSILAMALNWGNEGNREALLEGYGWTEDQVKKVLDQHMGERDWIVVQALWDHVESYWPAVEKMERELNGLPPEKVQATPVVTKYGTLRGGYYPIVFNSKLSWRQAMLDRQQEVADLYGGRWSRAMTRHGHTQERKNSGGKPMLLELSGLTEHIANVVHDLAYRRAIIDVGRLTQDNEVRIAIESTVGRDMYRQIHPWLVNIAGDRKTGFINPLEGLISKARTGATVVNLGWKMTASIVQTLGYLNIINEIGPVYAAIGMRDVFAKSWKLKSTWNFITARSEMMHARLSNYDRDVHDIGKRLNVAGVDAGPLSVVDAYTHGLQTSWFITIGWMDMASSMPGWMGGYRKAMDGKVDGIEKGDEVAAIDYADSLVRKTQGVGSAINLAAVQRGNETFKIFTLFYSYGNALYNQLGKTGRQFKSDKNVPRFVASLALLWFIPAVMQELMLGRGPEDDAEPEDWVRWLIKTELAYPFQSIVLMRDIVNGMAKYGYEPSAVFDVGEQLTTLGKHVGGRIGGTIDELTRADAKAVALLTGYAARLPTRQLWLTTEYLYDWMRDELDEEFNPAHALVTGKPKE